MKDFCPNCNEITSLEVVQNKEKFFIKKEEIEVNATLMKCQKCEELFENGQQELSNYSLAADAYRVKHKLLTTVDIKAIREKYGMSQRLLCRLFVWSPSLVCQYENGKIQDNAHNDLLEMIKSPWSMCNYYRNHKDRLIDKEAEKMFAYIKPLLEAEEFDKQILALEQKYRSEELIFTGKKYFKFNKTNFLIQFIASIVDDLYKTKLFKILYYIDFYNYKCHGESITGIPYCKLPRGPVPNDYQKFLSVLSITKELKVESWFEGEFEKLHISSLVQPNLKCFSKNEIATIKSVVEYLRGFTAKQISDFSHEEDGYQLTDDNMPIDYKFAEKLKLKFD